MCILRLSSFYFPPFPPPPAPTQLTPKASVPHRQLSLWIDDSSPAQASAVCLLLSCGDVSTWIVPWHPKLSIKLLSLRCRACSPSPQHHAPAGTCLSPKFWLGYTQPTSSINYFYTFSNPSTCHPLAPSRQEPGNTQAHSLPGPISAPHLRSHEVGPLLQTPQTPKQSLGLSTRPSTRPKSIFFNASK